VLRRLRLDRHLTPEERATLPASAVDRAAGLDGEPRAAALPAGQSRPRNGVTGRSGGEPAALAHPGGEADLPLTVHFPLSGYFVARDGWTPEASALSLSVPDHGLPNHSHDDALSLQLVARGARVVGTPASSLYNIVQQDRYREHPLRGYFRSMESHNVVLAGGRPLRSNEALAGGGGPAPTPVETTWETIPDGLRVTGRHVAYAGYTLTRDVEFRYHRGWTVRDRVTPTRLAVPIGPPGDPPLGATGNRGAPPAPAPMGPPWSGHPGSIAEGGRVPPAAAEPRLSHNAHPPAGPHLARWHFEYGVEVQPDGDAFLASPARRGEVALRISFSGAGAQPRLYRDTWLEGNPTRPALATPWVLDVAFGAANGSSGAALVTEFTLVDR
jgi:hypothetical protein